MNAIRPWPGSTLYAKSQLAICARRASELRTYLRAPRPPTLLDTDDTNIISLQECHTFDNIRDATEKQNYCKMFSRAD